MIAKSERELFKFDEEQTQRKIEQKMEKSIEKREKMVWLVDSNIKIMWFISHIIFFSSYLIQTWNIQSQAIKKRASVSIINRQRWFKHIFATLWMISWSKTFASNYKCVLFNLTKSVLMFVLLSYGIGLIPIYGHIEVSTMFIGQRWDRYTMCFIFFLLFSHINEIIDFILFVRFIRYIEFIVSR